MKILHSYNQYCVTLVLGAVQSYRKVAFTCIPMNNVQNPCDFNYEKYYFHLDLPENRVGRARKTKDQLGVA